MRFLTTHLVVLMVLACVSTAVPAREKKSQPLVPYRDFTGPVELPEDHPAYGEPQYLRSASSDTFCIVWFDFEPRDWQGWKAIDNLAEIDTFFHIDDFDGLGGGVFGRLVPIEGTKSAWCGVRAGADYYTCSWVGASGYGNDWDQVLVSDPFSFTGLVEFSYHGVFDSEEEYDYTSVEYASGEDWHVLWTYDGVHDTVAVHTLPLSTSSTKLRFHFTSDVSGSDQDGQHDTDGACIIDSITVSDLNGLIHFEDFESVSSGAMGTDFWNCDIGQPGYGTYAGLADNLLDLDPCGRNFSSQIIFFEGSPWMSDDYPGMPVTPFCTGPGCNNSPCQDVTVQSPPIDMRRYSTARDENQDALIPPQYLNDLGGAILTFTVYRDLPTSNMVFYDFGIRAFHDGCPWQMPGDYYIYYGSERAYLESSFDVSLDVSGADSVFIELDLFDLAYTSHMYMCIDDHTPAPYFDNVRLYRYATVGPQWVFSAADLFQDNFPSTDDIESFVRADMANDIARWDDNNPLIDPGDSIVVSCDAPTGGGLDTTAAGEGRVYFHCDVSFLGPDGKPDLYGPQLAGNYGTYLSDDGDWTVFLMEPARASNGSVVPDRYCVDLNDSLFTRGYMIEYYFKAYAMDGTSTTLPDGAETMPPYAYPSARSSNLFEFTCLPVHIYPAMLYVDDFDGRGTFQGLVQTYLDPAFDAIVSDDWMVPDRYDVNQPSSMCGNSLGSRARPAHLQAAYEFILWDSGDLSRGTIISATNETDRSYDTALLCGWLDSLSSDRSGLVIMGDNIAYGLDLELDGMELMADWCGVSLENSSLYEMTGGYSGGGIVNPLVSGIEGTAFEGQEFYLSGGCPHVDDFDVLTPVGNGFCALEYPEYGGNSSCAAVLSTRINARGFDVRTEWMGFSFLRIRNMVNGTLARNEFLYAAMRYWIHGPGGAVDITDSDIPAVTSLSGNFPNPFNPVTRVSFSLKEKGHVSMRIYDVSGRLVRVLVDEVREAGAYEVMWDGTNNGGRATASGIYFCRMEADDYQQTVKMVLLR